MVPHTSEQDGPVYAGDTVLSCKTGTGPENPGSGS